MMTSVLPTRLLETSNQGVDSQSGKKDLQTPARIERFTPKWCRSFQLSGSPGIDANMRVRAWLSLSRSSILLLVSAWEFFRHKDRNELPFSKQAGPLLQRLACARLTSHRKGGGEDG